MCKSEMHQSDLSDWLILTLLNVRSPIYLSPDDDTVTSSITRTKCFHILPTWTISCKMITANISVLTVTVNETSRLSKIFTIDFFDFLSFPALVGFRLPACVGRFATCSYLQ